jgi:two-component system cell cycle response regulator
MSDKLDSYQKCVESSLQEISALNIMYEQRVNELSTIISIFEYINMVTDYKNLFSIINDMLIGVLGASSTTIFIKKEGHYGIEASSLPRQELLKMDAVGDTLVQSFGSITETHILAETELKELSLGQNDTKSAVVVPLIGKDGMIGIIFVEHVKQNYFQPEIKRYLNTLAIAIRLSHENAQLYSRLEEMTLIDSLTGLYNRMMFNKEIYNCMEDYKKYGLPFVLSILDLDHFKKVNDNYGHLCGDLVLKQVSNLIRNEIRKDDLLCRYGGEEFAIIFRNTKDIEGVKLRLDNIRERIAETPVEYQDSSLSLTCSFGVVSCTLVDKEENTDAVVKKADEALYEAKRTGRNRICVAIDT